MVVLKFGDGVMRTLPSPARAVARTSCASAGERAELRDGQLLRGATLADALHQPSTARAPPPQQHAAGSTKDNAINLCTSSGSDSDSEGIHEPHASTSPGTPANPSRSGSGLGPRDSQEGDEALRVPSETAAGQQAGARGSASPTMIGRAALPLASSSVGREQLTSPSLKRARGPNTSDGTPSWQRLMKDPDLKRTSRLEMDSGCPEALQLAMGGGLDVDELGFCAGSGAAAAGGGALLQSFTLSPFALGQEGVPVQDQNLAL